MGYAEAARYQRLTEVVSPTSPRGRSLVDYLPPLLQATERGRFLESYYAALGLFMGGSSLLLACAVVLGRPIWESTVIAAPICPIDDMLTHSKARFSDQGGYME